MTLSPRKHFNAWADRWRADWLERFDTPDGRRRAAFDMQVFDHGFLRALYSNLHEVEDGVWRSNQPSPKQLERLKEQGFKSIVNLRGPSAWGSYHLEKASCAELGLEFHDVKLLSRAAPAQHAILELVEVLRNAPRPLLMHCKSGADRAGIGSAIYILALGSGDAEAAKAALAKRYGHFSAAKTGILDHFVASYAEAQQQTGMTFLDWVQKGYNPAKITRDFRANWTAGLLVDKILRRE